MRILFYSCFIFLILSCQGASQYDGHWHIKRVPLELNYNANLVGELNRYASDYKILDLEHGVGEWDKKHDNYYGLTAVIQNFNRELMVYSADCYLKKYDIELRDTNLYLRDTSENVEYIGYKCDKECCNKQLDYFSGQSVDIDLPIVSDTSRSISEPIKRSLFMKFHIGFSKTTKGYGSTTPRISQNNWLLDFDDIPMAVDRFKIKVPENYRDQIHYSITADKMVNTDIVIQLGAALQELGINECYIAVREDTDLHIEFTPLYIKYPVENLALVSQNTSIGEYIRKQY